MRLASHTLFHAAALAPGAAPVQAARTDTGCVRFCHLPPGTVRLKRGGGHGGHNGLRDILACLGSDDFLRLRVGVGHPGPGGDVVSYVLNRPMAEEARLIQESIGRALELLPRIASGDAARVMSLLNARPRPPAETTGSE